MVRNGRELRAIGEQIEFGDDQRIRDQDLYITVNENPNCERIAMAISEFSSIVCLRGSYRLPRHRSENTFCGGDAAAGLDICFEDGCEWTVEAEA
jgi:hypothetical protein